MSASTTRSQARRQFAAMLKRALREGQREVEQARQPRSATRKQVREMRAGLLRIKQARDA
jgi:hypothetical protein